MTESEAETALGYEQARDELIDVVRRLEAGGATLEESLALWERGEELARVCRHWLEGARARLDAARGGAEDADDADGAGEGSGSGAGGGSGEGGGPAGDDGGPGGDGVGADIS